MKMEFHLEVPDKYAEEIYEFYKAKFKKIGIYEDSTLWYIELGEGEK